MIGSQKYLKLVESCQKKSNIVKTCFKQKVLKCWLLWLSYTLLLDPLTHFSLPLGQIYRIKSRQIVEKRKETGKNIWSKHVFVANCFFFNIDPMMQFWYYKKNLECPNLVQHQFFYILFITWSPISNDFGLAVA